MWFRNELSSLAEVSLYNCIQGIAGTLTCTIWRHSPVDQHPDQPLGRLSIWPPSWNTYCSLYFNLRSQRNKQRSQTFELRQVIANCVRPSVAHLLTFHEPTKEHSDLRHSCFNVGRVVVLQARVELESHSVAPRHWALKARPTARGFYCHLAATFSTRMTARWLLP